VCTKFLYFQFDSEEKPVKKVFVICYLYYTGVERKVTSPPSSNSNWLFNPIMAFMDSYKQITNGKKNTLFFLWTTVLMRE